MLSILHRATGMALSVGALYLVVWVVFASASPRTYAMFQSFNVSILGRIFLGGWLFCAFYHLCNGIRHLFWDMGYGFELKDAYRSGWIVVAVSLTATIVSWIVGLRLA
jgi:succinate dehydrogenase / fumarate reductase cytochrome b subunit